MIRALLFVPLVLLIPFTLHAEKIRTVVPQSSLNYLSVYVAESRGFFHQEGFEHETLVLAGPVAAAALVGGNVDFGGGGGSAMRAAAVIFAENEGLRTLAFLGDLFPFPFQTFATIDKKLRDNPEQVKRWLRAMIHGLMFIRDNPEGAADVALRRLRIGNVSKPALIEAIKR